MKNDGLKILLLAIILGLIVFSVQLAQGFDYDPVLANYDVKGTIDVEPGELWYCNFHWHGGGDRYIWIEGLNMPDGMYLDRFQADPNEYRFYWQPGEGQVGTHYVDFILTWLEDPNDPNTVVTSPYNDWGTVVIRVKSFPVWTGISCSRD